MLHEILSSHSVACTYAEAKTTTILCTIRLDIKRPINYQPRNLQFFVSQLIVLKLLIEDGCFDLGRTL